MRTFTTICRHLTASLGLCLLAGCGASIGQPPVTTGALNMAMPASAAKLAPIKIAMLLPLGGLDQPARIAKAMKQAGEMALFDLNNPQAQIVVKDDKGTPEGARAAAGEALREGAEIVLGPLQATAVTGAAPVTRAANVPLISFSNDRTIAGNGVYLMSFLVEPEVDRVVSFAVAQGKRRFAALIQADAYGTVVEQAFRGAVQRHGGTIVALETYPAQANAMLAPAKRVVGTIAQAERTSQPVDAFFVPGTPETLSRLGPLLTYSGLNTSRVKLLGTGAWNFSAVGRDSVFIGGWYPGPDPRGFRDFSERFAKTFGAAPPRIASLAYDAVSAAVSLGANPAGLRFVPANLTRPTGFAGVDGTVRFGHDGLSERGLAILEVQNFGETIVDPAPVIGQASRLSQAEGSTRN